MLKKIHCDNPRLQASLFRIPDCHLLVINTYFPCDPRSASSDFIELTELLGDLESLISNVESSDSERYDTVVNLQDMKHSDTAALLVKDGKRK